MRFLLLMLIALPLSSFIFSERGLAGDICGNMTLEQCKQASKEAIESRESSMGKNISAGKFQSAYTDKYNQLSWSKALPGTYSNGCVDANGNYDSNKCTFENGTDGSRQVKVADSNAAKVCRAIGARLPTKLEFESLIANFDHSQENYGPRLTDKGREDMQRVFGDMNNWFWSSSVFPYVSDVAYDFSGDDGLVGYDLRDFSNSAVRCVVGR